MVHGRSANCSDYAWYDIDNKLAFTTSVSHLIELGHRRIGFVGAPLYYNFAFQRLQGYKAALRKSDIQYDESIVELTELKDDAGESAAANQLDSDNPPTAFVCVSDTQALGVLSAIRSRGLTAGTDVSVIGYDGLNIGRHTSPSLSTMAQPQVQSGRELGDMLLAVIDGDDPTDHQVLKRAELVLRNSAGPVRDRNYR